jgi:hypothetical protein
MSRHASRFRAHRSVVVAGVLASFGPLAEAQTIADYSHAQRLALESAMAQAAARSAGLAAPAPAVSASASAAVPAGPPPVHAALPLPAPDVQVSGVFASKAGVVAEVVVNGTPYLLESGERVPGTAWEVRMVAVDRVVLARHGSEAAHEAGGGFRLFALPAVR